MNRHIRRVVSFSFFLFLGCVTTYPEVSLHPPSQSSRSRSDFVAEGQKGMVVSAHTLASRAGVLVLRKGGNAVDAAVATSFAIAVLKPQSTGLGGGGFMLIYDAAKHTTQAYDFRERAPARASRNMYLDSHGNPLDFTYNHQHIANASVNGHLAVAVPGLVAGLVAVQSKYGKLPLDQVMAPAIDLADKGFNIYGSLESNLINRQAILKAFPASKAIFFQGEQPLKLGDLLIQKDLANTLRQIAQYGRDGFYRGSVAQKILAEMRRGKGLITQADLDSYKVKVRPVVEGTFRDNKIVSMPPPSSGGAHLIQMLNMLEHDDLARKTFQSTATLHLFAEVMRRAFADRAKFLGDPDFVVVPIAGLISKEYAQTLRKSIDMQKATPSSTLQAGTPQLFESKSTTHLSVVDSSGNAVSSTQTINYEFGSCVVAAGTGVVLNDEMDDFSKKPGTPNVFGLVGSEANAIAPGKTPLSSMSPTLVFDADGDLKMILGSPGGPQIISAVWQVILNVLAYNLPLDEAVHAYRIHHQWLPDELVMEQGGFDAKTIQQLQALGHHIKITPDRIGDVQAIMRAGDHWVGVSDTRAEGQPAGY